jgi:hypothetical protein
MTTIQLSSAGLVLDGRLVPASAATGLIETLTALLAAIMPDLALGTEARLEIEATLVGGLSGPVPTSPTFYAGFTRDAVEAVSFKFQPAVTIAYDYLTDPA